MYQKTRRYLLTVAFTIVIVLLYSASPINLYTINFPKQVSDNLFTYLRDYLPVDNKILIVNIGALTDPEVMKSKVDLINSLEPAIVGINYCHLDEPLIEIFKNTSFGSNVVVAACGDGEGNNQLSRIIGDGNTVTHFRSDQSSYFEIQVAGTWQVLQERNNLTERINYRGSGRNEYYRIDLEGLDEDLASFIEGKIVLIGYLGDYITEEIYYFKDCRITPMNQYYGHDNILPDMYDTQISANIISMMRLGDFINEVHPLVRVLILLAISVLNILLLSFIKTRWILANLMIAVIVFSVLSSAGTALIVFAFDATPSRHLELNELTIILIVTSVFSLSMEVWEKKVKAGSQEV